MDIIVARSKGAATMECNVFLQQKIMSHGIIYRNDRPNAVLMKVVSGVGVSRHADRSTNFFAVVDIHSSSRRRRLAMQVRRSLSQKELYGVSRSQNHRRRQYLSFTQRPSSKQVFFASLTD
jgi:hypothetical protein